VDERQRLLYDPRRERSACGIGLVADLRGRASRELLDRALAGLAAVGHRGAWAADGVTGDGAGVLIPLSSTLTGTDGAGVAMCFLREGWLRSAVEDACRAVIVIAGRIGQERRLRDRWRGLDLQALEGPVAAALNL